jgi:serine protease Do
VRIVKANGLDLDLFQFDYDQTWCAMFLNADRTIYGRYGTRASVRNNAATHISIAGFKKAAERALETHRAYPANKQALLGHAGPKAVFATVEQNPARFKGSQCIHCHEAHDGLLRYKWLHKQLGALDLWVYPLPERIGLRMDPEDCLVVKKVTPDSPAARAALAPGDRLVKLNGLPLLSQADIQWALHRAAVVTRLAVELQRGGATIERTVELSGNWKEGDLSWRESSWYGLRNALHLATLTASERKQRGLAADTMAFQVKNMYGSGPDPLRKAGLKVGDIILAVDGRSDLVSETQFLVHLRLSYPPGSRLNLTLLRGERQLNLEVPTW